LMRIVWLALLFLVGWSSLAIPPYPAPTVKATVVRVVDGDTIEVQVTDVAEGAPSDIAPGERLTVRYIGVDAPELSQENGPLAQSLNAFLVEGKDVYLEFDEALRDQYGRYLAYVYLDPRGYLMVNLILASTSVIAARQDPDTPRYNLLFAHADATPVPEGPGELPVVSWDQAASHVGQRVCVRGKVASVGTSRHGDVFLNLGNPYPNPNRFTVFIPSRFVGRFEAVFGRRFWRELLGKTVEVCGEVRLYKGVPEIQATDPSQLRILE